MRKLFVSLSLFLFSVQSFAQNENSLFGKELSEYKRNPKTNLVRCASDEYYTKSISQKNMETKADFENWLAPKVTEMERFVSTNLSKKVVVTIPVVVHVIHSGQAISNTSRNITDERVVSQITVLNQDYRRMLGTRGYNTNPVGADIGVEFCLAKIDPNGNKTNGIDRVNLGSTVWNENNVETILKPQTIWDPTKYLNIWVCQFGGDLNNVLGYAQFPQSSGLQGLQGPYTATTDGVIIDWRAFGSDDYVGGTYFQDINKGRTTTHEVGHFLGLRHIWGDSTSCVVNATDSNNDYCLDTPAQNTEHYDCDTVYDTCPSNPGNDMTENYMDYSNDTCMNTFTENQKTRILTVLQNSPRRASLLISEVCSEGLSVSESGLSKDELSVYPTLVKEDLNIYSKKGLKVVRYSVYNALGQEVLMKEVKTDADLKISKDKLGTGFFMIKIYTGNNHKTFKFTVE